MCHTVLIKQTFYPCTRATAFAILPSLSRFGMTTFALEAMRPFVCLWDWPLCRAHSQSPCPPRAILGGGGVGRTPRGIPAYRNHDEMYNACHRPFLAPLVVSARLSTYPSAPRSTALSAGEHSCSYIYCRACLLSPIPLCLIPIPWDHLARLYQFSFLLPMLVVVPCHSRSPLMFVGLGIGDNHTWDAHLRSHSRSFNNGPLSLSLSLPNAQAEPMSEDEHISDEETALADAMDEVCMLDCSLHPIPIHKTRALLDRVAICRVRTLTLTSPRLGNCLFVP